jgi:hypothetical protein
MYSGYLVSILVRQVLILYTVNWYRGGGLLVNDDLERIWEEVVMA